MEKTNEELTAELESLRTKYSALEKKYIEETNRLKKKEEESRLKLMFLEGVANSTIDGFLVVNPYGQKILQNQRTVELWKIPDEILKDPDGMKQVNHVMHMVVNPQQFVDEIDYLREHPDEKSRDELELKDGTVLDRYSSPVIGPDGKNYGRIWTFHDITKRKKIEKQLIQLNADKDRFISILSHDLRSPFNNLLGLAQLLKKRLRVYSNEKIEEIIDAIYATAKSTYELLEDTLLWASMQSKKLTFTPTNTNLSSTISEVITLLEPSAKAKKITLKNNVGKESDIYTDIYMFKAILRNLVSNAIKFTNTGGKVEVSASYSDSVSTIEIRDTGVGIQPETMEHLFDFTTIRSTSGTNNETGTGLGLLLCKEFVDRHGGEIWIDSEVNKGTIVSFTIPDTKEKN